MDVFLQVVQEQLALHVDVFLDDLRLFVLKFLLVVKRRIANLVALELCLLCLDHALIVFLLRKTLNHGHGLFIFNLHRVPQFLSLLFHALIPELHLHLLTLRFGFDSLGVVLASELLLLEELLQLLLAVDHTLEDLQLLLFLLLVQLLVLLVNNLMADVLADNVLTLGLCTVEGPVLAVLNLCLDLFEMFVHIVVVLCYLRLDLFSPDCAVGRRPALLLVVRVEE